MYVQQDICHQSKKNITCITVNMYRERQTYRQTLFKSGLQKIEITFWCYFTRSMNHRICEKGRIGQFTFITLYLKSSINLFCIEHSTQCTFMKDKYCVMKRGFQCHINHFQTPIVLWIVFLYCKSQTGRGGCKLITRQEYKAHLFMSESWAGFQETVIHVHLY